MKYSVIDLFAGAGGLSLGFVQTSRYDIKVAYENSKDMQHTYKMNNPAVDVRGDVCRAEYADILNKFGGIDVVIGGPPCQGFSNANRQKNYAISQNNKLVKQYVRAILELNPKAFVMENVGMLKSDVHRFYLEKKDAEIVSRYDIATKLTSLRLLDEQYMFDSVLDIIENFELIKQNMCDLQDYYQLNLVYKASRRVDKMEKTLAKHKRTLCATARKYITQTEYSYIKLKTKEAFEAINDYFLGNISLDYLGNKIEPAVILQRMLGKLCEIRDNDIIVESYSTDNGLNANIRSFAVLDYVKSILEKKEDGYVIDCGIICAADYGAPQKRNRFVIMGVKRSVASEIKLPNGIVNKAEYRTVRDAIEDIEDVEPLYDINADKSGIPLLKKDSISELAKELRDSQVLRNHVVTKTSAIAMQRFKALKQGENFHSLAEELKTNTYTDANRTQNTIYLRLKYDEPSGTVVNVRKSMWIHPTKDRAISIREAARLQTFPDSFIFCGAKDKQYQQVGNAVPPVMARAIAEEIAKILDCNKENT